MSLVIATYFWRPDGGSKFSAPRTKDVRRLQEMVARHCTVPHQFAVITDRPRLFTGDRDIRVIPIDKTTHVPGTCFTRLMTFHPQGRELIGERILQLDLDTVIVGNIDHLVTREEPLVLWKNPTRFPWADMDAEGLKAHVEQSFPGMAHLLGSVDWRQKSIAYVGDDHKNVFVVNQLRTYYNTSVVFHHCGTMPEIWWEFDPKRPPAKDDQWHLSNIFGMNCPYFDGERDGVYRRARADTPNSGIDGDKKNACVLTFPGSHGKMDDAFIARNPWIKEHLE
jgi:hypothetical protein